MAVNYYLACRIRNIGFIFRLPDNIDSFEMFFPEILEDIEKTINSAEDIMDYESEEIHYLKIQAGLTGTDLENIAGVLKSVRGLITSAKVQDDVIELAVETYSPETLLAAIAIAGCLSKWRSSAKSLKTLLLTWALSQICQEVNVFSEYKYDEVVGALKENVDEIIDRDQILI